MDMKELRKNAEKVIAERFPNFIFPHWTGESWSILSGASGRNTD